MFCFPFSSCHSLTTTSRGVAVAPRPPPRTTAIDTIAAPGLRSRRGSSTEEPSRGTASVTLKKGTTVRKFATSDDAEDAEEEEGPEPEDDDDDGADETDSDTPSMSFSAVTRCRPERPIAERSLERPEERA